MLIYSTINAGAQWEDFDEAVQEGLSCASPWDFWEYILSSEQFSYAKIVALIARHMPELYDDAVHNYLKEEWVSELYTDGEDAEELEALKDEAGF